MDPSVGSNSKSVNAALCVLLDQAADLLIVIDAQDRIVHCNAAVMPVLGLEPASGPGMEIRRLIHPEDLAAFDRLIASLRRRLRTDEAVLRWRHTEGSWRTLEVRGSAGADSTGLEDHRLLIARDITVRAAREDALHEALAEAEDLYQNASCGYHSLDSDGVFQRINDTELRWLGYSREEVVGRLRFRDLLSAAQASRFDVSYAEFKRIGRIENLEFDLQCKDGGQLPVMISATLIRDAAGQPLRSRSTVVDLREKHSAQRALQRVHRALRVRSDVSQALVRARSESELLQEVCRVIVEPGGYRMAWVGSAQPDRDRSVRVEASAGFDDGYLREANISWADTDRGQGPSGAAIRSGKAHVNRCFSTNPQAAPWRQDALARGYQSSIALPLGDAEQCFGALAIYAAEPDAFDPEEVALLQALADDLSFGMRTLRVALEHERTRAQVERMAYTDPLTGLPNRARMLEWLEHDVATSDNRCFAVLTLVVDRFHEIQSGIGLAQTEQLLGQVTNRLQIALHESERLARVGSDAFAVLQAGGTVETAAQCAQRIHEAMLRAFPAAGVPLTVQLSIGAALHPRDGEHAEALLVRSAGAARRARRTVLRYQLYEGMNERDSAQRLALVTDLGRAVERGEIEVYYQPKLAAGSHKPMGAEALLRWTHPLRGPIPPGLFVPEAERTGVIRVLTAYVLRTVIAQLLAWESQGLTTTVAVNVSVRNFDDADFVDTIFDQLHTAALPPERLQLELTESALMEDPTRVRAQLLRLAQGGVGISIDDFGTGYSSLSYLADLPISALKIDRSFIVQMLASERVHSIVAATLSLARALGMRVIAEGVDDPRQASALMELGCDELQGYLFSEALPAGLFLEWVRACEARS